MFMWFKEKDKKYLAFLNSPTFREHYDLGKKCDWLVKQTNKKKKRALQHRTELQAALVCTITIRCAAWGKKNNHCTPKKVNYETQCNSGKYKANNVITLRNL